MSHWEQICAEEEELQVWVVGSSRSARSSLDHPLASLANPPDGWDEHLRINAVWTPDEAAQTGFLAHPSNAKPEMNEPIPAKIHIGSDTMKAPSYLIAGHREAE